MAATVGQLFKLYWGDESPQPGVACRTKSLSLNGEGVDVTQDDANGWQTFISTLGQRSVELSVDGIAIDEVLVADWFAGTILQSASLVFQSGAIVAGTFLMPTVSIGAPYNEGVTFEATLQSSGVVTFTPAS